MIVAKKYTNLLDYESRICYNNKCQVNRSGCGETGRRAGLRNQCQRRGGSSPLIRTNDVSVRTFYRTERYKNQSENKIWLIFLFRISQTEQKLKKDNIQTEKEANKTHLALKVSFEMQQKFNKKVNEQ